MIYLNHSEKETKRNRHLYWASPYGLEITEVIANVVLFNFHNINQVTFYFLFFFSFIFISWRLIIYNILVFFVIH